MIKPPNWCLYAVPSPRGWHHPRNGELLVSQRFTQDEIDEFNGVVAEPEPVVEEVVYEAPQMLHEAPVGNKSLEDMTKNELLALAEQSGIKVSRYSSKKTLVEKLS